MRKTKAGLRGWRPWGGGGSVSYWVVGGGLLGRDLEQVRERACEHLGGRRLLVLLSAYLQCFCSHRCMVYSVGALMISVPALLGYLQEVCRARLPESELMRRKYHSVRQEDLQRVRLSRPEAVAEVKSL